MMGDCLVRRSSDELSRCSEPGVAGKWSLGTDDFLGRENLLAVRLLLGRVSIQRNMLHRRLLLFIVE